jgi:hypothetical protein
VTEQSSVRWRVVVVVIKCSLLNSEHRGHHPSSAHPGCVLHWLLTDPPGLLLSCLPDIKLVVVDNPAALDKAWDITLASGQQVKKTSQVRHSCCLCRVHHQLTVSPVICQWQIQKAAPYNPKAVLRWWLLCCIDSVAVVLCCWECAGVHSRAATCRWQMVCVTRV